MEEKFTKCAVCGKRFYVQEFGLYKWKHNKMICCSYSCMRVLEKQEEKEHKEWIKNDYERHYHTKIDKNFLKIPQI